MDQINSLSTLRTHSTIIIAIALKNLGDDINCRRCFEEALKRNGNDVEACINYSLFLYSRNDIPSAQKYYSHFQHLLNVVSKIDKELISMGESLSKVFSSTTPTTNPVEGKDDMSSENLAENSTEANEKNSSVEENNGEVLKPENSSRLAIISDENEIEPDDDLV